ncbi:hypothetical protein [Nocardia sp. NPDC046763]|uniref:hypothetical protein n=1 Tax=Nocardia sp. NPDC046763 TaxID=3155256 RepID=UPI00340AD501
MPEPTMYLPSHTTYRRECSDFAELRAAVEGLPESLNFPMSWAIAPDGDEILSGTPIFAVVVFMARQAATTKYVTTKFDPADVETWLAGPIRERTARWFGWNAAPPAVGYVLGRLEADGKPIRVNSIVLPEDIARDVVSPDRKVFALYEAPGLGDAGEC